MYRMLGLTLAATAAFTAAAMAAAPPERVRGTIQSVSGDTLTIHARSGKTVKVALNNDTHYAYVVKSSLSAVKPGSYIGTATTGTGTARQALEVVVFPPSMRGAGEGHYSWDKLPDPAMAGHANVTSSMTNGNVTSAMNGTMVNSAMTNGTIKSASAQAGSKRITVTYKGGQKQILVPPNAPIVTFQPATHAAIKTGAKVFIKAARDSGKTTAQFVAIGKNGVTPPM
jgi:hypothetical protein